MTLSLPTPARPVPAIQRERCPGLHTTIVPRRGLRELHITLCPQPGERLSMLASRLEALLRQHKAAVVRHEVFGSLAAHEAFLASMERIFGDVDWPMTWVDGASCQGDAVAGMHVFAVSGAKVDTVSLDGRVLGRVFDDGHARHCLLGDVRPADFAARREIQARQTFENIEAALDRAGMAMSNVVRTWLLLDNILGWYDPFNKVRREFFEQRRMFDHLVPASTGIGVRNPAGAALVAGAWAVQPNNGALTIREVPSPMQCPAPNYGSCFSRAVEVVTPGWRRLLISGTASIEPQGSTVCAGDVDGQIDLTMQVVRAILVSRGLDYSDVTRATAYLRNPADAPLLCKWRAKLGLERWPLIATQGVVCRDELLFEIELDAMVPVVSGAAPGWEI